MAEKVTISIDGQTIQAERGTPILKAALDAGLYIPHFCYYEGLTVFAGCRLCVVEIEGMRGFPTSCTMQVQEGMAVRTKTTGALTMQRGVMSFMLSDHPDRCLTCHRQEHCGIDGVCLRDAVVTYRCLTCAKNKRCEFQSGSEYLEMHRYPAPYYQEANSWYGPNHEEKAIRRDNPFIELDFNECILCARCVRACDETRGLHVYELAYRGPTSQIDTVLGLPMADVGCDFCGACIDVCPVACIMDRPSKWQALPQSMTTTICPHCADGCQITVETKRNKVLRVTPEKEGPANEGIMCARGRWGLGYTRDPQRLTAPLIRRGDQLVQATWEEALTLVTQKLSQYKGEAFGALGSAKATNEENYLLQKLTRSVQGSNNIDSYSRMDSPKVVQDLLTIFGYPAMTNSLKDISEAKALFIIGSNTAVTHPIAAWRARNPVRTRGSKLILAYPRDTEMSQYADLWLRYRPGTEVALLGGMLRVILDEGLADQDAAGRADGLDDLRRSLSDFDLPKAAEITGVPAEDIVQAARLYAGAKPATILYDVGLTDYTENDDGVKALAALALLSGNIGLWGGGLNALRGAANDQGAWDMGLRPDLLPGYSPVTSAEARNRLQALWGGYIPATPGLDLAGMVAAAHAGTLKAMFVIGADPALDDPNFTAIGVALEKLEFLVVQDSFLTRTGDLADVVLPACTPMEAEGTFTNTERRVQLLRPTLPLLGDSRPGWWMLHELGNLLGGRFMHEHAPDVFEEIAQVIPEYAGLSYERLDEGGIQWPCPTPDHEGTAVLYSESFPTGKARLLPIAYRPSAAPISGDYPLLLAAGRELIPYHKEVLNKERQGLPALLQQEALRLSPEDARRLGVTSGDRVRLVARSGQVEWTARVAEDVPPGVVYLSYPIVEGAAELLADGGSDLLRAIGRLGLCGVRLEMAPVVAGRS